MLGSTSPVTKNDDVLPDRGYALEPDCDAHVNRLREFNNFFGQDYYKGHFADSLSSIGNWVSDMGGSGDLRMPETQRSRSAGSCSSSKSTPPTDAMQLCSKGKEHVNVLTNSVSRTPWLDDTALVIDVISTLVDDAMRAETRFRQWWRSMPTQICISAMGDDAKETSAPSFAALNGQGPPSPAHQAGLRQHSRTCAGRVVLSLEEDGDGWRAGASTTIERTSARQNPASIFKVDDIHINVDALEFAVRGSNRDVLYKTSRLAYIDGELVAARARICTEEEGEKRRREMLKEARFHRLCREHVDDDGRLDPREGQQDQFEIVADKRDSPPMAG
ncbi:hypothetical protein BJ912DRAFT_1060030 [Pholiota molesta]|nr:hypothetical protein BJ912DRAFT_1060030 [Pholiota molesta]